MRGNRSETSGAWLEPPFVLVGHLLGGYNVRVYHDLYPGGVAALVLVDSAHPQQWQRLPEAVSAGLVQQVQTLKQAGTLARFGVLRLMQDRLPQFDLPPLVRRVYTTTMMHPQTYRNFAAEAELAATSAAQVEQTRPLDEPAFVSESIAGFVSRFFGPKL